MTFIVDYSLDGGETITREEKLDAYSAETRARYLSKKHHQGGYVGPLVYVFRKFNPSGQRVFFAGRTEVTEGNYLSDRKQGDKQ